MGLTVFSGLKRLSGMLCRKCAHPAVETICESNASSWVNLLRSILIPRMAPFSTWCSWGATEFPVRVIEEFCRPRQSPLLHSPQNNVNWSDTTAILSAGGLAPPRRVLRIVGASPIAER